MANVTSFNKDVRILDNLPLVLTPLDEIKATANVEDPILSAEWSLINDFVNNQFVTTANDYGLLRYEKMLGLKVSDTDTLDTRILRVLARYQEQAPYTWIVLNNILDSLLGVGKYVMTRDVAAKSLTVKLELVVKRQFDVLVDLLERVTPQNMTISVELRYNTHDMLSAYTHDQLSAFTQTQLREDVL